MSAAYLQKASTFIATTQDALSSALRWLADAREGDSRIHGVLAKIEEWRRQIQNCLSRLDRANYDYRGKARSVWTRVKGLFA